MPEEAPVINAVPFVVVLMFLISSVAPTNSGLWSEM
jgi:hypothetical protein